MTSRIVDIDMDRNIYSDIIATIRIHRTVRITRMCRAPLICFIER